MQKKLPFKPLMSAVIITSLFAIAIPASALTKVSGITSMGKIRGLCQGQHWKSEAISAPFW